MTTDPPDGSPDAGLDPDDRSLLDELRSALVEDVEPPPALARAARDAFGWRRIDADLAELTAEARLDAVRGAAPAISFSSGARQVEIELQREGARTVVAGQILPPATAEVRWETPDGTSPPTAVDALGMFQLAGAPPGPLRLVFSFDDGPDLRTDWVMN